MIKIGLNRFLALVTIICLCCAMVPAAAYGTDVVITNLQQLEDFARDVNSGNSYEGVNVYLEADIVLNDTLFDKNGTQLNYNPDEWVAIGTEKNPFSGNFDGNGHTISGLYVNDEEKLFQGLFGVVKSGYIRNIYIEDSYINCNAHAGAVVGFAGEKSVITSCHNVNSSVYTKSRSGGVVGWTDKSDVYNCTNSGLSHSGRCAGGIVGDVYSNGKIYNCENSGKISGGSLVGGITGGSTSADIKNCLSIGEIESGYLIAGGGGTRKITNCYAYKTDEFNTNAGGEAHVFSSPEAALREAQTVGDKTCYTVVDALNAFADTMEEEIPMTDWSQYESFPYLNRTNVKTSFGSTVSNWSKVEIEDAYKYDLVPEVLIGEDLTEPITRLEFAAVSVKTYESLANTTALPAVNNPFVDTNDIEVLKAYNAGITKGMSENEFAPNERLNREQAATMLTRVFKRATVAGWTIAEDEKFKLDYEISTVFEDDDKISGWAKESVYFMAANNIINGVGNNKFAPQNTTTEEEAKGYANATREQALLIAVRMIENLKNK